MKKTKRVQTTVVRGAESFKRIVIRKNFVKDEINIICFVAGYQYNDGTNIIDVLETGERLHLVREIYNPYDENAVAVYTKEYIQLGYIPRIIAPVIATRIEQDLPIRCLLKKVNRKSYHDDYIRLEINLSFPM